MNKKGLWVNCVVSKNKIKINFIQLFSAEFFVRWPKVCCLWVNLALDVSFPISKAGGFYFFHRYMQTIFEFHQTLTPNFYQTYTLCASPLYLPKIKYFIDSLWLNFYFVISCENCDLFTKEINIALTNVDHFF